jgi:arginase family enzyme
MNLSDYFNPVELDQPQIKSSLGDAAFFKNIYTHTVNTPVNNLKGVDVVIIGVGDDRNAIVPGSSNAPDLIRNKLYQLTKINKINIVDLGNFRQGKNINDTYIGLADVIAYLKNQNLNCLVIGGSNDLVFSLVSNSYFNQREIELTSIDARINFEMGINKIHSENYLNFLFEKKDRNKFFYNNLGNQVYLNNSETVTFLEKNLNSLYRLGEVKASLSKFEPVIRNSDIVAFDICAIKQAEAQGQYNPSPNGFSGEEACQLSWYAGLSDRTTIFGLFEVIPELDFNELTSGLAAQILWHYIYGVAGRYHEIPGESKNFKKFIIGLETRNTNISFYKSMVSDRWWLEITNNNPEADKIYIPCNQEDYYMACNHEIPDVWWKACQRYNVV